MIIKKLKKATGRFHAIPGTDHKAYLRIFIEIFLWVISNRGEFAYYFDYELYRKGKKISDYVISSRFRKIEMELNSPDYYPILEDKYFFYQTLEGQGYRSPKNLFMVDQSGILQMQDRKYISLEDFMQKDLDGFCKVINGFGGNMIFRILIKNKSLFINQKEMPAEEFLHFLGGKKYLIQERIVQHEEMNALNPSCINTLRMLTVRTGKSYQYYDGYLRMGINDSYVDNSLSGNIVVGVDKERGELMEYANSHMNYSWKTNMDKHPQTNTVFKGYPIPYYKESVEMVISLHQLFQQFFMIGWDIGITPEGPLVIEGNNITTLHSYQVLYGGRKSSFVKLANEYRMAV